MGTESGCLFRLDLFFWGAWDHGAVGSCMMYDATDPLHARVGHVIGGVGGAPPAV